MLRKKYSCGSKVLHPLSPDNFSNGRTGPLQPVSYTLILLSLIVTLSVKTPGTSGNKEQETTRDTMLMSCLQIEIKISIQSIFNKNFSCNPVLMVILMVIYNYHLSHPIFSETDSHMLRVEANSPFRMQRYLQEMSYHRAIRSRCPWWKERKSCQEREGRVGGLQSVGANFGVHLLLQRGRISRSVNQPVVLFWYQLGNVFVQHANYVAFQKQVRIHIN